jgi:glycosyltransferase involved in cell wall biosynthesis
MEEIREPSVAPRLSIILPAYNCEAFLEQTLDSMLSGLPEDYELIVVDDGSQDSTAEILKRYEGAGKNIRIAYRDHAGASGARNHGLDLARGEYVAFLDCDDCQTSDFLEKSRPLLKEQAGLYIFGIERIHLAGNSEFWTVRDRVYDSVSDFADDYIRTRQLLIYSNCNKFYCRRIIENAGLRFEESVSFGEDRLFNFDYLRLLDRADPRPAVITSSLVMLRYIQRDRLSLSSKSIPHYFRQVMRLHEAKIRCFSELSEGTSEEEKLDFETYDLSQEIGRAIDRFPFHVQ